MKVYISYETADRDNAQKIVDLYRRLGFDVLCLSDADRESADRDRISEEMIRQADVAVYIVSNRHLRSERRIAETLLLGKQKKAVIPIVLGDIADVAVPNEFATYRIFRMATPNAFAGLARELIQETRTQPLRPSVFQRMPAPDVDDVVPSQGELASLGDKAPTQHLRLSEVLQSRLLELAFVRLQSEQAVKKKAKKTRPGYVDVVVSSVPPDQSSAPTSQQPTVQHSLSWSVGYLLGHILVIGGLGGIGYLYWEKIVAGLGTLLGLSKGATTALPSRGRTATDEQSPVDEVDCSVWAPPTIQPRETFQVHVAFFLQKDIAMIADQIRDKDPRAVRKEDSYEHTLHLSIPRGAELTLIIDGNGLKPRQAKQKFLWSGMSDVREFWLDVPDDNIGWTYVPQVDVWLAEEYLGPIVFRMPCVASKESEAAQLVGEARGREPIFISYASEDRDLVRRISGSWIALRMKFWQDRRELLPGDQFPKVIAHKIDTCNTFFLFWTHNAKAKPWPRKEYLRAHQRRKESDQLRKPTIIPYGVPTWKLYRRFPWLEKTIPSGRGFLLDDDTHIKLPNESCRIRDE